MGNRLVYRNSYFNDWIFWLVRCKNLSRWGSHVWSIKNVKRFQKCISSIEKRIKNYLPRLYFVEILILNHLKFLQRSDNFFNSLNGCFYILFRNFTVGNKT